MKFTFSFYELRSAFGHPVRIGVELTADDGINGRYNRFFEALVTEVSKDSVDAIFEGINGVLSGETSEYWFGGGPWAGRVYGDVIEFQSDFDESLNDGKNNIFPLSEFIWVLLAWREFLFLEIQDIHVEYNFELPNHAPGTQVESSNKFLSVVTK